MDFNQEFYIPEIQKLAFYLPHVCILGMRHCGNMRREAFKRRSDLQDVLCRRDYAESVVARFAYQIQSEYYVGNRSVPVEGIAMELSSATYQEISSSTSHSCTHNAVFH